MHGDWMLGGPLGNSRCTAKFPVRIADGNMQGPRGEEEAERGGDMGPWESNLLEATDLQRTKMQKGRIETQLLAGV